MSNGKPWREREYQESSPALQRSLSLRIVIGRAEYNPAADLTSVMLVHESKHYPFLSVDELPGFFKALSNYNEQHRYYELNLKKGSQQIQILK